MRTDKLFRLILSLGLALQPMIAARTHAQSGVDFKTQNHLAVNYGLDVYLAAVSKAKTPKAFRELVLKRTPARDQAYVQKLMGQLKTVPKIERLNRGLAFTADGQRSVITFENVFAGRLRVNHKHIFSYDPNNSLEVQMQTLTRAMDRKEARLIHWLLPQAEAAIPAFMLTA